MDVSGAGPVDSEVEEGRAVGGSADFVGRLAAISDQGSVDTLLTVESRVAGGFVIDKEVAVLADVALSSCIGTKLASRCTNPTGTSSARNDVLSKCSASSVQFSLIAVVIASGGVIGLFVGLLPEVVGSSAGSAGVVVLVGTG